MLMHYCGRFSANGEGTLHEKCHGMITFGLTWLLIICCVMAQTVL